MQLQNIEHFEKAQTSWKIKARCCEIATDLQRTDYNHLGPFCGIQYRPCDNPEAT